MNRSTALRRLSRSACGVSLTGSLNGVREDLGRNLVLHRLEDLEFLALRQAARGEVDAGEIALDPLVFVEEQRPVHRLEIEDVVERLADAGIRRTCRGAD